MTPLRMSAVVCVTVALALYSVGILTEQRLRRATARVRGFLTAGVLFDLVATSLMILASGRAGITLHGVIGYTALAAMVVDLILIRRHARRRGDTEVPRALHVYSRIAYVYWLGAYFTGAALVMASRGAE